MKLIPEWRRAWRLFSMQALLIIGALQGTLAALPQAALESTVPGTTVTWGSLMVALSVITAVLGGIGRLVDQTPTS
jgi:ABC-type proline/glycine betaine transport system substrate-binding protein